MAYREDRNTVANSIEFNGFVGDLDIIMIYYPFFAGFNVKHSQFFLNDKFQTV